MWQAALFSWQSSERRNDSPPFGKAQAAGSPQAGQLTRLEAGQLSASAPKGAPWRTDHCWCAWLHAGCTRCSRQRSGSPISAERGWGTCHSLQYFLKRSKSISTAQPFRQFCGTIYNFPLERWKEPGFWFLLRFQIFKKKPDFRFPLFETVRFTK